MNNETRIEVETRPQAGAEAVKTALVIDWSDMSADDVRALAQQSLIVKLQSGWRKNGIPSGECTVKAADHKIGVRAPKKPLDILAAISTMTAEQKAEILARLSA